MNCRRPPSKLARQRRCNICLTFLAVTLAALGRLLRHPTNLRSDIGIRLSRPQVLEREPQRAACTGLDTESARRATVPRTVAGDDVVEKYHMG